MVRKKIPLGEDHKVNRLSEIILGGQDGIVNVLGVVLGVAAASQETRIVLAAGLAATFAESISMAAVAYTSKVADRDFYLSELKREMGEIKKVPHVETEEVREIYRRKGFKGKLLEDVVKVIISDKKNWLHIMMTEELRLSPVEAGQPLKAAFIVGLAAIIGSFIPLIPFFLFSIPVGIIISILISAVTLFMVGAVKAHMTVGHWGKSGLEMAIIGTVSALAGYGIGLLFQVSTV
jgi:vacuolar iron transporter family protein